MGAFDELKTVVGCLRELRRAKKERIRRCILVLVFTMLA